MMRLLFLRITLLVFVLGNLLSESNICAQTLAAKQSVYAGGVNDGYSRTVTNFGMSINESSVLICTGEKLSLSAIVKGDGVYLYKWSPLNNSSRVLSDSSTCVFSNITVGDAGMYCCEVTERGGTVRFKDTVEVKVYEVPTITLKGRTSIAKGDSVWLEVVGTADELLWTGGAKGRSFWVKPETTTKYMVTATNGGLCRSSADITVEVIDLFVRSQGTVHAVLGEEVVLKVETNTDSVDWYQKTTVRGRSALTNEYGTYIGSGKEVRITPTASTEYTAVAIYEGTAKVTTLLVSMRDNRFVKGGENDGYTRTVTNFGMNIDESLVQACAGDKVTVSAIVKGEGTYIYKWARLNNVGGVLSDSSSCTFNNISQGDGGKYYCEVTDKRGMVSLRDTVEIKVYKMPTVSIVGKNRMAKGDSVFLEMQGSADEVIWTGGSKEKSLWVKPTATTKYMVTGVNGGLCRSTAEIEIEVVDLYVRSQGNVYAIQNEKVKLKVETNADEVKWYEKVEASSKARSATLDYGTYVGTGKEIEVIPTKTTEYNAVATFEGATKVTVLAVLVRDGRFHKGGNNDGYTRTASDFGVESSVSPAIACEGVQVDFSTIVKGESIYEYEWKKEGGGTMDDTSHFSIANVALGDAGKYICKVTDARLRIFKYDTVELVVNQRAIASIKDPAGDEVLICIGDSLTLIGADDAAIATTELKWTGLGSHAGIGGDPTNGMIKVSPPTDAKYVLTASNEGCSTTDTILVKVNRPEIFLDDQLRVTEGSTAIITAKDVNGNPLNSSAVRWVKDRTTNLGTMNPLVIPSIQKSMMVTAEYTSGMCKARDSIQISVKGAQAFRGGNNDGYTRTCQPPVILNQKGMDVTQCVAAENSSLQIIAEGTRIKYEWQKLDIFSNKFVPFTPSAGSLVMGENGPILTFTKLTEADNGSYRCVLTNGCSNGEVVSDTFPVAAKGEPIIVSGIHDRFVCKNEGDVGFNIVAKGTAKGTELFYQWYHNGKLLSEENNPFIYITVDVNNYLNKRGLYKVVVSTECGSVADSANLKIEDIPAVTGPKDSLFYICKGGEVTLWVETSGSGDYHYWLYDLTDYSELKPNNLIDHGLRNQYTDKLRAGQYKWKVTSNCNTEGVLGSMLTVKEVSSPIITVLPQDTTRICTGQTLTLNCEAKANGGQTIKYIWYKDGIVIRNSSTSGTLTIPNVTVRDAGSYQCEAYNSCTPVKSPKATVIVNQPPRVVGSPSIAINYCVGDSVPMMVVLSEGPQVDSMRWYFKGNPLYDTPKHISGATTTRLLLDSVRTGDEHGNYTIRVYGICGNFATSKDVSFELKYPARFKKGLDGVDLLMCAGGASQTLQVEVDPNSTAPVRYKWLHNKKEVANGTSSSLTVEGKTLDEGGKYTCQVQNECGNEQTEQYIKVHRPDTFRFEGGGRYCQYHEGVSAQLVASDTSVIYQLYRENPKTAIGDPVDGFKVDPQFGPIQYKDLKVGTYYVTALDTNGCYFDMPGKAVVTEDKIPTNFDLSVSRYMCVGELDGDLKLGGSELNVVYYLCREKSSGGWDTLRPGYPGNGMPLIFRNIPAGTYRVIAESGVSNCWADFTGRETIKAQPLPIYTGFKFLGNDSVYCSNAESNVGLTYDYERNHKYHLRLEGVEYGNVLGAAPLEWKKLAAGRYSIEVTNEWGCKATFGQKLVRTQEPPRVHQLIGTKYFCTNDTDTCGLELLTSDAGVKYSFRYKPTTYYKDTLSQGGAIRLKIPAIEREYYVIAIDTTEEHCESAMRDTISLLQSRIQIFPISPVKVPYEGTIRLKVDVKGYVGTAGELDYMWGNAGMLADIPTLAEPMTKKMITSQIFPIQVKDKAGCVDKSDVVVNVTGSKLEGEILQADCLNPVRDTLIVCSGVPLEFCSTASGGGDTDVWKYQWWDKDNANLGTDMRLKDYVKKRTGFLHWMVTSGVQSVRDSIWVIVNPTPRVDTLEDAGMRCVQATDPIQIELRSSENGAHYRLEGKMADGSYQSLAVEQAGTGGKLTYSLTQPFLTYSHYRIVARMDNIVGGGTCEQVMEGELDVREGAKYFNFSGIGGYCKGVVPEDTLTLAGSESGLIYTLMRDSSVAATKTGTSGALEFIGHFEAGIYKVFGTRGDCRDTMPGVAEIKEYALPLIDSLLGEGVHCTDNCPIEIGVATGLKDVEYTLQIDTLHGGVGTEIHYGEGKLIFGEYCTLGSYKVLSRDTVRGCVSVSEDSVVIADSPAAFEMDKNGFVCTGAGTALVSLSLKKAQENVKYYLYSLAGIKMGEFVKRAGSLPFPMGDTLWFNGSLSIGKYVAKAQAGSCELQSTDTVDIRSGRDIVQPGMSDPKGICEGTGLTIEMNSSMEGVRYSLYREGRVKPVLEEMGTGATLRYQSVSAVGTYYIVAVDTQTLCSKRLVPDYEIEKRPTLYSMTGETAFCENSAGVTIGLNGFDSGMHYELQRKNTSGGWDKISNVVVTSASGLSFSGTYKTGVYRVIAGEFCQLEMNNQLNIESRKEIEQPIMSTPTEACEGSGAGVEISMSSSMEGVRYSLYRKGVSDVLVEAVMGSGAGMSFSRVTSIGDYYIMAVDTQAFCEKKLIPEYKVEKRPTLFDMTGKTDYCEDSDGVVIGLNGNEPGMYYLLQRKNASGGWDNITDITTSIPTGLTFSGKHKMGIYRVLAGRICQQEMNAQMEVKPVKHPNKLLVERIGMPCVDSTMKLVVKGTKVGETYELFENNVALVGESQAGSGGTLTWTIPALKKSVYTIKTTISECSVTLDSAVHVGKTPQLSPLSGDSIYCAGMEAKILVNNSESGVKYGLYVSPEDTLFKLGTFNGGTIVFDKLKQGSYYVIASDGDCRVKNGIYKIREQAKPAKPQWELNDCVESDSGQIVIKNRMAGNEYTLGGASIVNRSFKKAVGDTVIKKLPIGIYTLQLKDTLSGCLSDVLTDTIREGVYLDSLVGAFEYCAGTSGTGAILVMSGVRTGIDYRIQTPLGGVVETIKSPTKIFSKRYVEDNYVFKKVRTGYLGGCSAEKPFIVKRRELPRTNLSVTLVGAPEVCAGGLYSVKIDNTEAKMRYLLRMEGSTSNIDTLYGNGTTQLFGTKISKAGKYKVIASDTILFCEVMLENNVIINPLPIKIDAEGCSYCQGVGEPLVGCEIQLKRMQSNVEYSINGVKCSDAGKFLPMGAGVYKVVMNDVLTGCKDTVEAIIKERLAPKRFSVDVKCEGLSSASFVALNGSEGDTVVYQLYRDGRPTGKQLNGTGARLTFTDLGLTGTYSIYAYKPLSPECGVFMKDSVVIYKELLTAGDKMTIKGDFCEGSAEGVMLEYPVSTKGWKYYITNGVFNSDTIAGNDGLKLLYSRIGSNVIQDGMYSLYAINPCGGQLLLADASVFAKSKPADYVMTPTGVVSICSNSSFEIKLSGSDADALYTVTRFNTSMVKAETYPPITGGANPLTLGRFTHAGYYEVSADNGCTRTWVKIQAKPGISPTEINITGESKCLMPGTTEKMQIGLQKREEKVIYYLHLNGGAIPIDTLQGAPLSQLKFKEHGDVGCYSVIGQHETSGCSLPMKGEYCMSTPPTIYDIVPKMTDTVKLCLGEKYCIGINNSEVGIQYELVMRGATSGRAVAGTGSALVIGCAEETGTYRVLGKVGTCEEYMNDSVMVKVSPLPELTLKPTYNFCEATNGVKINVEFPTFAAYEYRLYAPDGSLIETIHGKDGSDTLFNTFVDKSGYYKVEAKNPQTECIKVDSTLVTEEHLPTSYDLISSNGRYICHGSYITFTLMGSEPNVTYELVREPELVPLETQFGRVDKGAIKFAKQIKEPGVYKIKAINGYGLQCPTYFPAVTLELAPALTQHKLKKEISSYCSTDANSGVVSLDGSTPNIVYELKKNGLLTGDKQTGTGGVLTWGGLEGGMCTDKDSDGIEYRIVGYDPATNCWENMWGMDTIVAVDPLVLWGHQPTELLSEKCTGEFVRFSMTVTGCRATYTWEHNEVVFQNGPKEYYNIDSVTIKDAGYYRCVVNNACNKPVEMPMKELKVRELVKLVTPMEDVYICDNVPRDVLLSSGFKNAFDYSWYLCRPGKQDSLIGSNKDHIEFPKFRKEQSGKYICKAENGCSPPGYDTCVVSYNVLPSIDTTNFKFKEDTICKGRMYALPQIKTENANIVHWQLNGEPLAFTGSRYIINSADLKDQGTYSVIAENTCGSSLPVAIKKLWVDEPLTLIASSPEVIIKCVDETEKLFVTVTPDVRVNYRWEYMGNKIGDSEGIEVGKFTEEDGVRKYTVWYWNHCGPQKSKEFAIHVPRPVELGLTGGDIVACADCSTDTVIRLNATKDMMAEFQWYVQYSSDTTNRTPLSKADTVAISRCSQNTGYYYCNVHNRCKQYTTETWWVRIDSVPVIKSDLLDDSVCVGGWTKIRLKATGGGLEYQWHILKKGETVPIVKTVIREEFESVGELIFDNAKMEDDSTLIWCVTRNTCGEDLSDTMMLRVIPTSEVGIEALDTRICEGAEGRFVVRLISGLAPWSYACVNGTDTLYRRGIIEQTDTIKTKAAGKHRIVSLEDSRGCRRTGNLGSAEFEMMKKAYVTLEFAEQDPVCFGETVTLNVKIKEDSDAIGPWELEIRRERDGDIATEVMGSSLVIPMTQRDTSFTFKPLMTESYYARIWRIMGDGTTCEGEMIGKPDTIFIKKLPQVTSNLLTAEGCTFGSCNNVDLVKLFNVVPKGGTYLRNGERLPSGWSNVKHKDIVESIVYEITIDGCTTQVYLGDLTFVAPPKAAIIPGDEVLCEHRGTTLYLKAQGAYPIKMGYQITFIDSLNRRLYAPPLSPSSEEYTFNSNGDRQTLHADYRPEWNGIIYEILRVEDKYKCLSDTLDSDTVIFSHYPKYYVETRYEDGEWQKGNADYIIRSQDSIEVRGILLKGEKPWNILGIRAPLDDPNQKFPIGITKDTASFWMKGPGYYEVRASNKWGCIDSRLMTEIYILHADTGYIKLKAVLEGPYDKVSGKMVSNILNLIDKGGLSQWPIIPGKKIIDWVTVEVWTEDLELFGKQRCLLLDDGTVVDSLGSKIIALPNTVGIGKKFHIALRHRNHLPLMSKLVSENSKIEATKASAGLIDLTRASEIYVSATSTLEKHAKYEASIGYMLYAGEVAVRQQDPLLPQPRNSMMTMVEPNQVALLLNTTSISVNTSVLTIDYDVNYDGKVEWPVWGSNIIGNYDTKDWFFYMSNRNKTTEVPLPVGK